MTGRYTIRTGINHHCYKMPQQTGLPKNERLLPAALRQAGYETWFYGKVRAAPPTHTAQCMGVSLAR